MPKETLNSRQRVHMAIEHKETDRMPIDLGVHFSTGISVFAYKNLREYLGLDTGKIEIADCIQLLARVDDDIIDLFHIDTMLLNPPWPETGSWNPRDDYNFIVPSTFTPHKNDNGSWELSYNGQHMYMPEGGFFFDGGGPDFYGMDEDKKLALFAKRAEKLHKETDKFIMMMGFTGFFYDIEFACKMLLEPDECKRGNEIQLKNSIEQFDKINRLMGKYIDSIEVNSDLGTQMNLMCTPDSYIEICYPYLKKFCDHVHNTSNIKIFMHSCGAISSALPYICDAGVDAINPVQISAKGMEPNMLKEKFGDKICFWGGGCNTQEVLWCKTPDEIKAHVKNLIGIFKPNGGFVFNQVHNIMGNVPPENIVAMLNTAYENSFF